MTHRYWLVASVALVAASCGKKPVASAPREGWVTVEGWKGSCYFPKDYANLGPGDRKLARQAALEEMMKQWGGQRDDGVSFDATLVENIETVLLGRPEHTEAVSQRNAALCEQYMSGAGDMGAWESYLSGVPAALTVGECNTPLVDTVFNYLNIGTGWQNRWPVCKDNRFAVIGSEIDYYRITDNGPWINAAGDASISTAGKEDWPCNTEECVAGMLIMRFTGESGIVQIVPIGLSKVWTAPENGHIEVQINDNTWFDNKFKIESGLEHHTSITYKPA